MMRQCLTRLLTLDEYMVVLQQRLDNWVAAHPPIVGGCRCWWGFIRDSDDDLVALLVPEVKPKPRHASPASVILA